LLCHVELAFEGDGAHRRKVISAEILPQNGRLPYRGVSANHHRQQVEAELIDKENRPAFFQCPYLKRPRASKVSAVCICASDGSLANRVRLHAMLARRSRPIAVVRTSEALN
jgi:hypothetical protein